MERKVFGGKIGIVCEVLLIEMWVWVGFVVWCDVWMFGECVDWVVCGECMGECGEYCVLCIVEWYVVCVFEFDVDWEVVVVCVVEEFGWVCVLCVFVVWYELYEFVVVVD